MFKFQEKKQENLIFFDLEMRNYFSSHEASIRKSFLSLGI